MKILSCLLILSNTLYAATVLHHKSGDIFINDQKADKGASLKIGDIVRVGSPGLAIIKFDNRSVVKLSEKSILKIESIESNSSKTTSLILQAGSIFSKVLKKSTTKDPNFKVRAKAAVMGVRGTEFFTAFSQDKAKPNDLWMCVNEGMVEVTTDGSKGKTSVAKGEGIFIGDGSNVTAPKPYGWTKKLNWKMDPKTGDLTNTAMKDMYQDLLDQDYD